MKRTNRRPKQVSLKPRLTWTRAELVAATGLSYRTIQKLEERGLLERCAVGINVVCYTDSSVQALFCNASMSNSEAP